MYTASEKKRENIAEYILYMWQIEDLIRANDLDIDKIRTTIIDRYTSLTDAQRRELTEWYESLIDMMRREDKEKSGHLQLNANTMADLEHLHRRLLADPAFAKYSTEYYDVLPLIVELRAKAGDNPKPEIETLFDALYGLLMLRIGGKEVSQETKSAARRISSFLGRLAGYYKQDYNNELKFSEDR